MAISTFKFSWDVLYSSSPLHERLLIAMAANVTSTPHHEPLVIPVDILEQLSIGHFVNVASLAVSESCNTYVGPS
jgi:hypothetical protein